MGSISFTYLAQLYLLEIVGFLLIGLVSYVRLRQSVNRSFAVLALFVAIWQAFQVLALIFHENRELSIFLLGLSVAFSCFMATQLLTFARKYTGHATQLRWYIPPALIGVLALVSPGIKEVEIAASGIGVPRLDAFYGVVLTYDFLMLLLAILTWVIQYRTTNSPKERDKLGVMLFTVGVAGIILLSASFYTSEFSKTLLAQQILPTTLLVTMAVFAYAMAYKNLFDIHIFALRALAYLSTYFMITLLSAIPIVLLIYEILGREIHPGTAVGLGLLIVMYVYLVHALRTVLDKASAQIFFKSIYDPQQLLDEHNSALAKHDEIEPIISSSMAILHRNLRPSFTTVWVKETDSLEDYIVNINIGRGHLSLTTARQLEIMLEDREEVVIVTENLLDRAGTMPKLHKRLSEKGIACVVRIALSGSREGVGYVFFGQKMSGDVYGARDVSVLQIVSNELAMATQSALRFEEIRSFNRTLQTKIDHATKELVSSNKKLTKLDETKDEFISMASHQLRTPLTSVKGYISMVLDGDAGEISKEQRQLLEQAFESSQRMVYLIGDFLNISRLRTGKFVLEPSEVDLARVVQEEIAQLRDSAKARGIAIRYDKPSQLPCIIADENKLRQVMMNFMDNAMYYTLSGGHIEVELYKSHTGIVFKVVDSGIGVPKTEQAKLFTKFFRAPNARKQRPDGTGIGLYMAKKVVVAHGGSIIFQSREGKGSMFGFKLPLVIDPRRFDKPEEPEVPLTK